MYFLCPKSKLRYDHTVKSPCDHNVVYFWDRGMGSIFRRNSSGGVISPSFSSDACMYICMNVGEMYEKTKTIHHMYIPTGTNPRNTVRSNASKRLPLVLNVLKGAIFCENGQNPENPPPPRQNKNAKTPLPYLHSNLPSHHLWG